MKCKVCEDKGVYWSGGQGGDWQECECKRTIRLDNHMTWPRVGSVWEHRNGNRYEVLMFTNIETERQDRYPTTIVYRNVQNLKVYSRPLLDWERSMIAVTA